MEPCESIAERQDMGRERGQGQITQGRVSPSGALSSKDTYSADSSAWCPTARPGGFSLTPIPSTTPSTSACISAGRSLWPQSSCAHSQGRSPAPSSPPQQLPGAGMNSPAPLVLRQDNSEVQNFLHCQTGFPRDGAPVGHGGNQFPHAPFVNLLLFHPRFPPPPGFPGVTSQIDVLGERQLTEDPAGSASSHTCMPVMETWWDSTVGLRGSRGEDCGEPTGEWARAGWPQRPFASSWDRSCRESLRLHSWGRAWGPEAEASRGTSRPSASRGRSRARLRSTAQPGSHSVTTMKDSMPRRMLRDERPCRASQGFWPSLPLPPPPPSSSWRAAGSLLGWLETHDDMVRAPSHSHPAAAPPAERGRVSRPLRAGQGKPAAPGRAAPGTSLPPPADIPKKSCKT